MNPLRVLVIDDSAFMRKMITEILSSDHRLEVIGTAPNGKLGLEKISNMKPDVVTLDVEMPVMDGITTLRKIMETTPIPVVMLSSATGKGANKTLEAISIGAVDFITKPSGPISLNINVLSDEIIAKVIAATGAKKVKVTEKKRAESPVTKSPSLKHHKTIIAIGTSTGGPRALQTVLSHIPKRDIPPIVIVQHMPAKFTKSLAERLDKLAPIGVKEAIHGDILRHNMAYIAPGGYHMRIRTAGNTQAIELTEEEPRYGHRPSVDTLFESLADVNNVNKIAIVLTGMGKDGAEGCKVIKSIDPHSLIIAESEESAVINGMPQAAVDTGTTSSVVHLNEIGSLIGTLSKQIGEM